MIRTRTIRWVCGFIAAQALLSGCGTDQTREKVPESIAGSSASQAVPTPVAPDTTTELEHRARISGVARQAFLSEDFGKLEEMSRTFRTTKSRTPSGTWNLTFFYMGIRESFDATARTMDLEAAFKEIDGKIARWTSQYPDSPSAHVAQGLALIAHGWTIRGEGYSGTVRPRAWAPFRRYIALARETLEKYKSQAAEDPRWYEAMLTVARAQGWDREEFNSILSEALAREPLFYQTYFTALEYLLPKWHGDIGEIEAFAREAVRRTSAQEGRGMYARIYWAASQHQFKNDLFSESLAIWPQIRDGFDDVLAKYPSAWNLNYFARFACLARDKAKTRELFERIGDAALPQAWGSLSLLGGCSTWSSQE